MLDREIIAIQHDFPHLRLVSNNGFLEVEGRIDVCDSDGAWWQTFDIRIKIPASYPKGVPTLYEISQHLVREDHVGKDGECCVAMKMDLQKRSRNELTIQSFLKEYVRPFFSSQLYFQEKGVYPGGEHRHGFVGQMDRYFEILQTKNPNVVVKAFNTYLNRTYPNRGNKCWCGSGAKYGQCHLQAMKWMQGVYRTQIEQDRRILLVLIKTGSFEKIMMGAVMG